MSKTLEQLAKELEQWRQDLAAAESNMSTLRKDHTFQMLAGDPAAGSQPVKTTGLTNQRVAEAVTAFNDIELNLPLVAYVVQQADEKWRTMPSFFQGGKVAEIDELLNGTSVKVSVLPASLQNATLLSAVKGSNKARPRDLLDAMLGAFQKACVTVVAVSKAWDDLEAILDQAPGQLEEIEKSVAGKNNLYIGNSTAVQVIADCRKQLSTWQANWKTDPLGTLAAANVLTGLKEGVAKAEHDARAAENGIASAREVILRLEALGHDGKKVDTLKTWLGQIQDQFAAGSYDRVQTSLETWNKTAKESWDLASGAHSAQPAYPTYPAQPPRVAPPPRVVQPPRQPYPPQPSTYVPGVNQHPVDRTRVRVERGYVDERPKSDLEKLLDGELAPNTPAPTAAAPTQTRIDPGLEDMLSKSTSSRKTESTPSHAVESLLTQTRPAAASTTPAPNSSALGALIEGSSRPAATGGSNDSARSGASTASGKGALEQLLSGGAAKGGAGGGATPTPEKKPEQSGNKDALTGLMTGKPTAKPPGDGDNRKKLDDLFK